MSDALVLVDVKALAALSPDERVSAIAKAYGKWGRIKVDVAWAFGCALRDIRPHYSKGSGDWGRVLETIGIDPCKARRYMRIAEHDSVQIARYLTVDAAYKAVKAVKAVPVPDEPAPEPETIPSSGATVLFPGIGADTNPSVVPAFSPRAAFGPAAEPEAPPVEPEPTAESVIDASVIDAVAAEEEPTAAELRGRVERLEERIAIILEGQDGKAVDATFAALEAEKQAHARTHADRNQVLARERKKDRTLSSIRRDLLSGKSGDDVLARVWSEAPKAA